MDEIKVGMKSGLGLSPTIIHTGALKEEPVLIKTKIEGMEERLAEVNKKDLNNHKKIEIDTIMFSQILKACADDLSSPRKIKVDGSEEIVNLLNVYDARNQLFYFNKDISFINKAFNLKLNDLVDFLSNFLYTNINTYSLNLFDAVPELLPLVSSEVKGDKLVSIIIH